VCVCVCVCVCLCVCLCVLCESYFRCILLDGSVTKKLSRPQLSAAKRLDEALQMVAKFVV